MHPDLQIIRDALYSGQISAAKVDAQRAFDRLFHVEGQRPEQPAAAVPTSATVVATWDDIKELFHLLWGECASGKYDKPRWVALQNRLWRLEAATEALNPTARENLIAALRRIELPR